MTIRVALAGCGRMGGAMARGWVSQGLGLDLKVFEPALAPSLTGEFAERGWAVNPDPMLTGPLDAVILAVKPQVFTQVSETLVRLLVAPHTLVVSIMAGIPLERLGQATGAGRVIRAMPNTPGQIGRGITPYVCGAGVSGADEALAATLLGPLGPMERLQTERQIDAATAVSGSGPAYLFLLVEALAAAAEAEGLEPELAARLARQTVTGSAALLEASGQSPLELRRAVTSPEGTTAAALDVLTGGAGLVGLMRRAVEAASQRARQLGKAAAAG